MADAEPQEYLVDGKPVFDDEGNRIPSKGERPCMLRAVAP